MRGFPVDGRGEAAVGFPVHQGVKESDLSVFLRFHGEPYGASSYDRERVIILPYIILSYSPDKAKSGKFGIFRQVSDRESSNCSSGNAYSPWFL